MSLGKKILKNKAWMTIAIYLVLLIIFSAFGWIQTTWGTWTMAIAFFAAVSYAIWWWFKGKK